MTVAQDVQVPQDAVTSYSQSYPDNVIIEDLDVILDFDYDMGNTADVTVIITSPSGTSTNLWDFVSGCGGTINYICDEGDVGLACANFNAGTRTNYKESIAGLGINVDDMSIFDGENAAGEWTVTFDEQASPGGFPDAGQMTLNEVTFLFNGGALIEDVEAVEPTDNCTNVTVTSSDVVTPGSCETGIDRIIERTFVVTDQNGLSSECTQTITVTTIGVNDIIPPVTPVELPCGSGTSPEDIATFFDDPNTNDITNCSVDVIEKNEGIAF